jgi:hypothetical protein
MILIQEKWSRTCARKARPSPSSPKLYRRTRSVEEPAPFASVAATVRDRVSSASTPVLHVAACAGPPSAGVRHPVIPSKRARLVCDDEAEWRDYGYPLFRGDIGTTLTRSIRASAQTVVADAHGRFWHRADHFGTATTTTAMLGWSSRGRRRSPREVRLDSDLVRSVTCFAQKTRLPRTL